MSYPREKVDVLVDELGITGKIRLSKTDVNNIVYFLNKYQNEDIGLFYEEQSNQDGINYPEVFHFTVHKQEPESDEHYFLRLKSLYVSALRSKINIARNIENLAIKIKELS